MTRKYTAIFIIIFSFFSIAKAQVGIDNPIPDSTSVLDLKSTNKGFLIPRMSTTERNAIIAPARSLLVFDTDLNKFMFWEYQNSEWAMLNPWYSEEDKIIHYGATNNDFKVNIAPTGGNNIFRVSSDFTSQSGNNSAFQTEFTFTDHLVNTSGIKFNSKISLGTFTLMQASYNAATVMTLKSNGNMGLGYTSPSKRVEVNGEIEVSGSITADKFNGNGITPIGGIVMWSGSIANIPSGWALCDGSNGTPNLKDRFLVGSGNSYNTGDIGGESEVVLSEAELPSHNHTGTTNNTGSHTHKVARSDMDNNGSNSIAWKSDDGYYEEYDFYGHSSTANWGKTNATGSHSHTLNISSNGNNVAHENKPPYYALAFIMRTN